MRLLGVRKVTDCHWKTLVLFVLIFTSLGFAVPFIRPVASDPTNTYVLTVIAIDESNSTPIQGALVKVSIDGASDIQDFTDSAGVFRSPPLPYGIHFMVWDILKAGYRSLGHSWNWEEGDLNGNVTLTISLAPKIFATCDENGVEKTKFKIGETVYVKGSGFPVTDVGDWADTYVVNRHLNWTNGMPIPTRVPGTVYELGFDELGIIVASSASFDTLTPILWKQTNATGKYDVVVNWIDYDGEAVYDSGSDWIARFEVVPVELPVPEYWLGTIMSLTASFAAIGLLWFSKRRKSRNVQ